MISRNFRLVVVALIAATLLAAGVWLNLWVSKRENIALGTRLRPRTGLAPVGSENAVNSGAVTSPPSRASELQRLRYETETLRKKTQTEPVKIETAFLSVGAEIYRKAINAAGKPTGDVSAGLESARIFANRVHMRFLDLETMPSTRQPSQWWYKNARKTFSKNWKPILEKHAVAVRTFGVYCLVVRNTGWRPPSALSLEVHRQTVAKDESISLYDMDDFASLAGVGHDDEQEQNRQDQLPSETWALGELAPGGTLLVPLGVLEAAAPLGEQKKQLDPALIYEMRECLYLPKELRWVDSTDGEEKRVTASTLLEAPLEPISRRDIPWQ